MTTRAAFARLDFALALLREANEINGPRRFAVVCDTLDELIRDGRMRMEDAAACLSVGLDIPPDDLLEDLRRRYVRVL